MLERPSALAVLRLRFICKRVNAINRSEISEHRIHYHRCKSLIQIFRPSHALIHIFDRARRGAERALRQRRRHEFIEIAVEHARRI
jgi:hypothetical protein